MHLFADYSQHTFQEGRTSDCLKAALKLFHLVEPAQLLTTYPKSTSTPSASSSHCSTVQLLFGYDKTPGITRELQPNYPTYVRSFPSEGDRSY